MLSIHDCLLSDYLWVVIGTSRRVVPGSNLAGGGFVTLRLFSRSTYRAREMRSGQVYESPISKTFTCTLVVLQAELQVHPYPLAGY